jgi:hypothetical protein
MQITLWLILAGTLGLAALVTHARQGSEVNSLGPEQSAGQLKFKLPRGWRATPILRGMKQADDRLVAIASEGANLSAGSRTMCVYYEQLDKPADAEAYLNKSGLLGVLFPVPDAEPEAEPTTLAGQPALAVRGVTAIPMIGGAIGTVEHVSLICGVLPNNQAVTIVMTKIETPIDQEDQSLLEDVAESVRVTRK